MSWPTEIWIEQTLPDHALGLGASATTAFAEPVDAAVADARRAYLALLERESAAASRHESLLVVTIRGRLDEVGQPPIEMAETLNAVASRCVDAGLDVDGLVSPEGSSSRF